MAKKKKDSGNSVSAELSSEEKAVKKVLDCRKEFLTFYDEKLRRFNYFDRLYLHGAAKRNTPYGRANLELPLAFQQIEPFVSQMTEIMFGEAPYTPFVPRGREDEQAAEEITNYVQYQYEEGGLLPVATQYERSLGKYGTGVLKVTWEVDYVDIPQEVEEDQAVIDETTGLPKIDASGMPEINKVRKLEKVRKKTHDGPKFYNLPLFDFMIPKSASSSDVQKLEWCIHRLYRSPEELLSNPNYINKAKIRSLCNKERDSEEAGNRPSNGGNDEAKQTSMLQKNEHGLSKYEGKIEVLEWWGRYCLKNVAPENEYEELEPALIVVAVIEGESILLRKDENPLKFKFKPFIASNDYSIEGEFYGHGELYHVKGLIEESTALRNARLDVANLSLNSMWLVERQSGINVRELYSAPNKVIFTNDNNAIKRMDMSSVTPASIQELARIDFDIQNTTEIINPRQDVSNVGAAFGGTATGVNFLSSRTNMRLMTKARIQEETLLKPLAKMMNWYNKDLLTDEMYFRVANGDNPYHITPESFLTEVDFKPTGAPERLSRMQRREDLSYMLQVIAQIEKVAPGTNDLQEILKEVWRTTGFPHPEKYVKNQQTTLLQLPNGQVVDTKGQPPQVIPVDEQGKPLQEQGPAA